MRPPFSRREDICCNAYDALHPSVMGPDLGDKVVSARSSDSADSWIKPGYSIVTMCVDGMVHIGAAFDEEAAFIILLLVPTPVPSSPFSVPPFVTRAMGW